MTPQFVSYYKKFKYEIGSVWHDDERTCQDERQQLLYRMIYHMISSNFINCPDLYKFMISDDTLRDLNLRKERYYSDNDFVVYTTQPWFNVRNHSKVCYKYDNQVLFNFSAIQRSTNIDSGIIQAPFYNNNGFLQMF